MAANTTTETALKVADEVWIAAALLHHEHPEAADFAVEAIVERARREGLHKPLRPGVYVHVIQHCVANRPANPGRYRMLFETDQGRRRLFRKGDPYHPDRDGKKITPEPEELPETSKASSEDPLLALQGSGKRLWADEHADAYVRRLRQGWE